LIALTVDYRSDSCGRTCGRPRHPADHPEEHGEREQREQQVLANRTSIRRSSGFGRARSART